MSGRSHIFFGSWISAIALLALLHTAMPNTTSLVAPVVETDRPIYPYNVRDILLSGSGLTASQYFIWLRTPAANQSNFTGESFTPTATGNIPYPNVRVPLEARILGTYIVTLSTSVSVDTESARSGFGLFGPMKSVYERREMVKVTGGGASPGSTIRIAIRTPTDALAHNATAVADERGQFSYAWYLENNVPIGSWLLSADGMGTYNSIGDRWHVDAQFGVRAASLRMSIYGQPAASYQRTQKATIAFMIKYPDGSPVVSLRKSSKPVTVIREDSFLESLSLVLMDPLNGVWIAELYTARNESSMKNYSFMVSAEAFDDAYGNVAPSSAIRSTPFVIVPAKLLVSVSSSKRTYEIVFDQIVVNATVMYHDGTRMIDGNILAQVRSSQWSDMVTVLYDTQTRDWRFSRQLGILDLPLVGIWSVELIVSDRFGNTGMTTLTFEVSVLWFVVSAIAVFVLVVVLVRWISEEKALVSRTKASSKAAGGSKSRLLHVR